MEITNPPLVSILVLNYNGLKFLDDCFKSLFDSTYQNYEVIMIDNLSTDESVVYTKNQFPQVKIFQNGVNGGFSLAYNNAFKIATGKYFVILNNDVKVDPGWLEPLVNVAENELSVGALQPKLVSMLEPDKFEYGGASGGFLDKYGYPFARGRVFDIIEKDFGQYDDIARVFWTSGAAMFLRAEVLKYSGDLDVDFVHHMEEIDLCYRINLVGYELKVVPQSKIYHFGGGIISYESYRKLYWNHRNSVFMMLKNLQGFNLVKIIFIRSILDFMTIISSLTKLDFKRFAALFHAYFWLISHPQMIIMKHRAVQKLRKVSDDEIFKLLYPKSIALQYFFLKKNTYNKLMNNI